MTDNGLFAGLRTFNVLVLVERSESWSVIATSAEEARENYEDGELEGVVELFAEVQEVGEAA